MRTLRNIALTLVLFFPAFAQAQLASVCPTVVDVSSRAAGSLVQYKNNQVQRNAAGAVSGFLRSPTIIATQGRNPFSLARSTVYNSSGKAVCTSGPRLGCSSTRGECLARYKFNCTSTALRKATSGGAFVKVSPNVCIRIPNAGKCYNVKVRGLCDGRAL